MIISAIEWSLVSLLSLYWSCLINVNEIIYSIKPRRGKHFKDHGKWLQGKCSVSKLSTNLSLRFFYLKLGLLYTGMAECLTYWINSDLVDLFTLWAQFVLQTLPKKIENLSCAKVVRTFIVDIKEHCMELKLRSLN